MAGDRTEYNHEYNRRPEVMARKNAWAKSDAGRRYQKEYQRKYGNTETGRVVKLEAARKSRLAGRQIIIDSKSKPCMDCGQSFHPCQMQFDHRPGVEKRFTIGRHSGTGVHRIKREIAKCDVVCANCHALRTWMRRRVSGA